MSKHNVQNSNNLNGIIPLPSEWWRVNGIIQECLTNQDFQKAKNILAIWKSHNVVSSSYFECLLDIYICQLRACNDTSIKKIKLCYADHNDINNLLSGDCQRGVNLAIGSQKQVISKKWQMLGLLYDEYCNKENRNKKHLNQETYIEKDKIRNSEHTSDNSKLKSKDQIQKKFESILHTHSETLQHLSTLDFKHDSLKKIKREFIDNLEELISNIREEYRTVRDEIVWDHLVIGFFGETNAGKSTIIETLRLRYASNKNTWTHGEIVGQGESDFTKDASEYELNINGQRVTLIDIPGIEGDESKYSHIIAKALRKAHYVFYVHKKNSRPDTKIASRIQHYLSDWTRVCSIYNVSNSIGNYDEAEDRVNLYTDGVVKQADTIKSAFKEMLGSLYEENITLQAQVGLCASSEFSNSLRFSNDARKLRQYFKDADTAYAFSRFNSLIELLDTLNGSFDKVIIDSQKQKLSALRKRSRLKLENFERTHKNLLSQLEDRFREMTSDVKNKIYSSKKAIQNRCDSVIHRTFSTVERSVCDAIDNHKDNRNQLESSIRNILWRNLRDSLPYELNTACRDITTGMTKEINKRIKELNYFNITIKNPDIDLNFQYQIDTDSIIHHLKISLGDVLDVASGAAGGAGLGSFGGPIGMGIGALLGAGAAVAKKKFFGDGGAGKAKNAAKDELRVCKSECIQELRGQLRSIEYELSNFQSFVIDIISREANNLRNMQNQKNDIYRLF